MEAGRLDTNVVEQSEPESAFLTISYGSDFMEESNHSLISRGNWVLLIGKLGIVNNEKTQNFSYRLRWPRLAAP